MASTVTVKVDINQKSLERAVNFASGTGTALNNESLKIAAKANALSAGYRTPKWHDHETGETKGDTPARYDGNSKLGRKGYVGIVFTANYAAQKENHLHNTLLKAKG